MVTETHEHSLHLPKDVPDTAPPPHPMAGWRGVVLPVVNGSIVGLIFVLVFVALFHAPKPHSLPVGIIGAQEQVSALTSELEETNPGSFDVHSLSTGEARQALERREIFGIYNAQTAELQLAGANGPSATGLLTNAFTSIAHHDGEELSVTDIVPTSENDSYGLSTFYAGFGVVLAGFLFGQLTYAMAPMLPLRRRLLSISIFAVVNGAAVALIAGRFGFGALPGNLAAVGLVIALLAGAIAISTVTIIRLVGQFGSMIAAVLLLILGNATGGGTLPIAFLPSWLQWLSEVLPVGVGIQAIKGISYFNGSGFTAGIYVPLIWIALCIAILASKDIKAKRSQSTNG